MKRTKLDGMVVYELSRIFAARAALHIVHLGVTCNLSITTCQEVVTHLYAHTGCHTPPNNTRPARLPDKTVQFPQDSVFFRVKFSEKKWARKNFMTNSVKLRKNNNKLIFEAMQYLSFINPSHAGKYFGGNSLHNSNISRSYQSIKPAILLPTWPEPARCVLL